MPTSAQLREVLQSQPRFAELARAFIEKSAQLHSAKTGDPLFGQYLKRGLNLLLEENLRFVFELTESPIETIFINSLLLAFIKNDPLDLVIQHSVRNAPRQIEGFRERRARFKEFVSWYKAKYSSLEGVEEYLNAELARGKMEPAEHGYLRRHLVLYEYLALENRFHLVIQPGIPDIRVEEKTVRPDMLIWIPADESVKIIVECDGFQHHSDKVVFIHDRKRDRALKAKGYEVLRYSGTEIYNDPVSASVDLAEYLWSMERGTDA
jgi:hypothetical protein